MWGVVFFAGHWFQTEAGGAEREEAVGQASGEGEQEAEKEGAYETYKGSPISKGEFQKKQHLN